MGTGSRIEDRRKDLQLGQEELAAKVRRYGGDISQTGIDKIEKRDTARPRFLKEIASALAVTEEWLLTGREPKERPQADSAMPPVAIVPIVSWVSAGRMGAHDAQDIIGQVSASDLDPRGNWIALRVEGDSMDRISPPGSIIVVNTKDRRLVPNACYVIADGDQNTTYKRFRPNPPRFEPVSTNPAHEPIFPDGEPMIVGRVKRSILEM